MQGQRCDGARTGAALPDLVTQRGMQNFVLGALYLELCSCGLRSLDFGLWTLEIVFHN